MKKITPNRRKLVLERTTVARLTQVQLRAVAGGAMVDNPYHTLSCSCETACSDQTSNAWTWQSITAC